MSRQHRNNRFIRPVISSDMTTRPDRAMVISGDLTDIAGAMMAHIKRYVG
jgi:3',5'-cyclic AMP phosphodiesterase CpdA